MKGKNKWAALKPGKSNGSFSGISKNILMLLRPGRKDLCSVKRGLVHLLKICRPCWLMHSSLAKLWVKQAISLCECNTILSAFTLYRHLG